MSPVKTRRADGRTGMTSRTSGRGRTAATARTQSAVPRPAQQSQEKNNVKGHDQDDCGGFAPFLPIKVHVALIMKEITSIVFVLLSRFRCNSEQWAGGIGSVLSGHPSAAD